MTSQSMNIRRVRTSPTLIFGVRSILFTVLVPLMLVLFTARAFIDQPSLRKLASVLDHSSTAPPFCVHVFWASKMSNLKPYSIAKMTRTSTARVATCWKFVWTITGKKSCLEGKLQVQKVHLNYNPFSVLI